MIEPGQLRMWSPLVDGEPAPDGGKVFLVLEEDVVQAGMMYWRILMEDNVLDGCSTIMLESDTEIVQ